MKVGFKLIIILGGLIFLMSIGGIIWWNILNNINIKTNFVSVPGLELATVTKVIDGDTIEISHNGKTDKLRYIGIDTPETVDPHRPVGCFGHEASLENASLVANKKVILESDVEDKDKFGRLLRYVYLQVGPDNWLFINDYLIRMGYAIPDSIAPDIRFNNQFDLAGLEAKNARRGLWQRCQ